MSLILLQDQPEEPPAIRTETTLGNPIGNEQYLTVPEFERAEFSKLEQEKHRTRSGPTAVYNCHGMTFASRRAYIWEVSEVLKILKEDGYEQIQMLEALPGDVIIYFSEIGDAEHSGIVVDVPSEYGFPKIVSKWGKWREVIHYANDGPYLVSNAKIYRLNVDKQCSNLQAK